MRKYPDELRERAVQMAVDLRRDPATRSGALRRVGEQLGINAETLRNWVQQAEVDEGHRPAQVWPPPRRGGSSSSSGRIASCGERMRSCGRRRRFSPRRSSTANKVSTAVLVDYIDAHRDRFGVEPICAVLRGAGMQIAPSTYYAAKARPPPARTVADRHRLAVIRQVHADNHGVYGVRKMQAELNRRGHRIARCTVHRLMRANGLRGISRVKGRRTTVPGSGPDTRPDLLDRTFVAPAPDRVWVADITYCRTFAG